MGNFALWKTLFGYMVVRLTSRRQEGKCEVMQGWMKAVVAELERKRLRYTLRKLACLAGGTFVRSEGEMGQA